MVVIKSVCLVAADSIEDETIEFLVVVLIALQKELISAIDSDFAAL
jgi:hypothetical protein